MWRMMDLFSGIGGFTLAAQEVWGDELETVCFCEIDPFCQEVLGKHWPNVPIVGDIRELIMLCEQMHKEKPTLKTCNLPLSNTGKIRSDISASIADEKNISIHISADEKEGSAQGNADTKPCVAMRLRTIMENGCEERTTQTIRMETDITEADTMEVQKRSNGEGESLQGTNILAGNAGLNQGNVDNSMPIISRVGWIIQKEDMTLTTVLPSVSDAIRKSIYGGREIDLLTAGIPCQPFSHAGKRRGRTDKRYLWPETFRCIRFLKPKWCIIENVYGFLSIEGGLVFESCCTDLENLGYAVQAFIIPACAVGAPHRRDRVWFVAHLNSDSSRPHEYVSIGESKDAGVEAKTERTDSDAPDAEGGVEQGKHQQGQGEGKHGGCDGERIAWLRDWREVALGTCVRGVDDGLPARVYGTKKYSEAHHRIERLKSLGNSIVSQVAVEIMKAIRDEDDRRDMQG